MKRGVRLSIIFIFLISITLVYALVDGIISVNSPQNNQIISSTIINLSVNSLSPISNITCTFDVNGKNFYLRTLDPIDAVSPNYTANSSISYLDQYTNLTQHPFKHYLNGVFQTCDDPYISTNDLCYLWNSSGGNNYGGYTQVSKGDYFEIIFDKPSILWKIDIFNHASQYMNNGTIQAWNRTSLQYNTIYDGAFTSNLNTINLNGVITDILKFTVVNTSSVSSLAYFYYMNLTGQWSNNITSSNFIFSSLVDGKNLIFNCSGTDDNNIVHQINNINYSIQNPIVSYNITTSPILNISYSSSADDSFFAFDDSISVIDSLNVGLGLADSVNISIGNGSFSSVNRTYESLSSEGVLLNFGSNSNAFKYTFNNNLTNGYTYIFNMKSNSSDSSSSITSFYVSDDRVTGGKGGFTTQFNWNSSAGNISALSYYVNASGSLPANLPVITFAANFPFNFTKDIFHKILISYDAINERAKFFIDGKQIYNGSMNKSLYVPQNSTLLFRTVQGGAGNITIKDIVFLNRGVYDGEDVLLSSQSVANNTRMYLGNLGSNAVNHTLNFYYLLNKSVYFMTNERFSFAESNIVYVNNSLLNPNSTSSNSGTRIDQICQFRDDNNSLTNSFNVSFKYGLNGTAFSDMTPIDSTYINGTEYTWAWIGDSMSNSLSEPDFPAEVILYTGIPQSQAVTYAVAGYTCNQTYQELINNVTNGTTHLFVSCGINSFASTNTSYWDDLIYRTAKAKNITYVHFNTIPPYQSYAIDTTNCNKMHTENNFILSMPTLYSDSNLTVIDVFNSWYDDSGLNITDCGWKIGAGYSNDGTHPTTTAARIYGYQQWTEALDIYTVNNYRATLIVPINITNGVYNFVCQGNSSIANSVATTSTSSIILNMNTTSLTTVSETTSTGSSYLVYKPTEEKLQQGYEASLQKNGEVQFNFNNENHTIKLKNIINGTAIVTISSNPITFNLTINETKKINLDNDNYYDLSVFLKNISTYHANLVIKTIHEEIPAGETGGNTGTETNQENNIEIQTIFYVGIVVGVIAILFFIIKKKPSKKKKNRNI